MAYNPLSMLPDWPRAHGPVEASARVRAAPEDFRVEEVLGFGADGDGPHVLLQVEKRGANTRWVADRLAQFAGVPPRDVGYAGLKDRDAVTVQHFTLPLGNKADPDWNALSLDGVRVLSAARHRRKLKIGVLKGNRFRLVLRELSHPAESLAPRLEVIARRGVPNYFGLQRFGRGANNIAKAEEMLAGRRRIHDRKLRGLLLSTARSVIFNALLAERVRRDDWDKLLPGEVLMLDGSRSVFRSEASDEALPGRLASGDVHPTGPLWGRGELISQGDARVLEEQMAREHAALAEGLIQAGVDAARRSLRLPLRELAWEQPDVHTLVLGFYLPAGAYATTVLREMVNSEESGDDGDAQEN
ncbi:MAG TPA: tRNA pseudouridine(13) synthase TruD [Gammaproteobacteria bacterium]|nr:tRNA pseudouridine(13) synthase TruD [Gammaproteobacteria bacterium]